MKVKMLVSMAGRRYSYKPGDIVEVETKTGKEWIKSDIAAKPNASEEKMDALNHKANDAEVKPKK